MRLYIGSSQQFIADTVHNQITDKLKSAFFNYFRYLPSLNEIRSWRQSLSSISQVFMQNKLLDHGIILEYQIPLTSKRLDCMITGKDEFRADNAVKRLLKTHAIIVGVEANLHILCGFDIRASVIF